MHRAVPAALSAIALTAALLAQPAAADYFIDSPTTLNHLINDQVVVGYNNTSPFTVAMVRGAEMSNLLTYNKSVTDISYINVHSTLRSHYDSIVDFTLGGVNRIEATGDSTVNFSGGNVYDWIAPTDDS